MRVLVIGSGGREHALVWKLAQSKTVDKIFCAPGNGGIAEQAECFDIQADDIQGLKSFAHRQRIGLTVVGPEAPLAQGLVDEFYKDGLNVFGPNRQAAKLEASKVFAKEIMSRYNVPTAAFGIFNEPGPAKQYIEKIGAPCVVKADGLAAGKGVVVAKSVDEAQAAVSAMMEQKVFGQAGTQVIIEECLVGQEASILVLTDGKDIVPLATSQDHKRIFDNDAGPNTGGMGAYSPAPVVTAEIFEEIMKTIIRPTIDGLAQEGIVYRGVLYAGVMLTRHGPKTLEFNVRFGDPETQAILPRLESDLLEAMYCVSEGSLSKIIKSGSLRWSKQACVCVVCAAKGYPNAYEKGQEIRGLKEALGSKDVMIFHAGTKLENGKIVSNGGRVLGITGLGATIKDAISTAYGAVKTVSFDGMQYRSDIGRKALS